MKILLVVLMLIGVSLDAGARLGQTKDECDVRYGRMISHFDYQKDLKTIEGYTAEYNTPGYRLNVIWFKGESKASVIQYYGKNSEDISFTDEAIKKLLELNSEGYVWTDKLNHYLAWERNDGGQAKYVKGHFMSIETGSPARQRAEQILKAMQNAAGIQNLDGL